MQFTSHFFSPDLKTKFHTRIWGMYTWVWLYKTTEGRLRDKIHRVKIKPISVNKTENGSNFQSVGLG